MFTSSFPKFFSTIVLLSSLNLLQVFAQETEASMPVLEKEAMQYYNNGDFYSAEPCFLKLMSQFPGEPMYRYYTGICKVELNKDLEAATELLIFSSSRGVPEDVYYYLGEAYRKLYDFEKATNYYTQFDKVAPRSLSKEKNSKLSVSSSENAKLITSSYNPYKVLNVTFVNLNDDEQYSQVKMIGGDLELKPEVFFAGQEDRNDYNALMFMPRNIDRNTTVFFSSMAKNGKDGFEIMQAKRGASGKWTGIESVSAINSEKDEILPYFDPVGKDIYFASDGREGLGGFDLYRSHYDEVRNAWSEPVNMGFPINSVYDDYLLLPGNDLGMVIIFSGRQATDTAVAVYRVQFSEPKKSLASSSPKEIRRIANLDGAAFSALSDITAYAKEVERNADTNTSEKDTKIKTQLESKKEPEVSKDQELIAMALKHQSAADSLTELSTDARIKVRESNDPNDRWLFQKQIMVWEKKAIEEQNVANEYFASFSKKQETPAPSIIEVDTVINDLTVYRYNNSDSLSEKAKQVFQKPGESSTDKKQTTHVEFKGEEPNVDETISQGPKESSDQKKKDFEILEKSSYTDLSPIPMNEELPKGPYYKIQLGVFSQSIEQDVFGGLKPISGEKITDRNIIKYYVGSFTRYEDVQKALPKVRELGYKDAFIVGWYDAVKMSLEKVRKLEK